MSGIQLIVRSSMPPALRMFSIGDLGACHHLKCSLRISLRLCSSDPVLRTRRLLSILNLVQSDGELSVPSANSRTTGPRGTPASLLWARSPGMPAAEPGAGPRDDEDGPEEIGALSLRSGGMSRWSGLSDRSKSFVVAFPSGSSAEGSLPSLGCLVPAPLVRGANFLSLV